MKKFSSCGNNYYGCKTPQVGLLIYDPEAQIGVEDAYVRLFDLTEEKTSLYSKAIIRNKLVEMNLEEFEILEKAISKYSRTRSNQRVTHCYACRKHLDSVDFSICSKCSWIRCACGACGCRYKGT
jgi:hypothetical protein